MEAFANFALLKKLFTILMIMLFGLSSSGASLQLHYCCGELKSISLSYLQKDDCCSTQKSGDCCESKVIINKDKSQAHELYNISLSVKAAVEPVIVYPDVSALISTATETPTSSLRFSPPLAEDIITLHCVFRI